MYTPLNTRTSFPLRNVLLVGCSVILTLVLLAYLGYQARFLIMGPHITLLETGRSPTNEPVAALVGEAENITYLTLNGRPIFTDQHGVFNETLVLNQGYNLITIVARDRYGREQTITQEYVRTPRNDVTPTSVTSIQHEVLNATN